MDTVDIHIESCAPLNANRESLFRRFFANAFRPSIRQATVVLVDQGFCSIANFLTGVLVARACSKAEYGIYVLGFTLLVTAIGIQTSLAGTPFTVLSPPLKGKDHQLYLGSTLIQHLAVSAMASVGFIIAAAVVFAIGRTDSLAGVLFALALASVFVLLRDFMRYVLLAQLRIWASLLMGLAANILTVGMLFWAFMGGWLTAPVAYLIMAGCSGLPVIFVLLRERKQIAFATNKLQEHIRRNWRFGKWLIARTAAYFFSVQIYPWALVVFKGASATGVYGACMTLAGILNPLFMGIIRYVGPKTAHAACGGSAAVRRTVYLVMSCLAVPVALFMLAFFLFGELALVRIFSAKYAGAGHILAIYAIGVGVETLMGPIASGLHALRRTQTTFRAEIVSSSFSILFGIPAVVLLGPCGAALGFLLSSLSRRIYCWIYFQKLTSRVSH